MYGLNNFPILSFIIPNLTNNLLKQLKLQNLSNDLKDIFSLIENDILDNSIFFKF